MDAIKPQRPINDKADLCRQPDPPSICIASTTGYSPHNSVSRFTNAAVIHDQAAMDRTRVTSFPISRRADSKYPASASGLV